LSSGFLATLKVLRRHTARCLVVALAGLQGGCAFWLPVSDLQTRVGADECVVVLHGLWRSGFAMRKVVDHLDEAGYHTVNLSYPSHRKSIRDIVREEVPQAVADCRNTGARKIHMVGHSMGGIVARAYLQDHALPAGSRLVLISSPNQGAELSDAWRENFLFDWVSGPAGRELATDGLVTQLRPVPYEIGVIAGDEGWALWSPDELPSPNDGTVSVSSTRLPEMKDFLLVHQNHVSIRYDDTVFRQVVHFLRDGLFDHTPQQAQAD